MENNDNYKQIIYGNVPSKSNQYNIITIKGHSSLAKSKKLKEYERDFYKQCTHREKMITGLFKIDIDVYYTSMRPDLDNAAKIVLDCLQACRVIKNDNQCIEYHSRKLVDKLNPRVEFTITPVNF